MQSENLQNANLMTEYLRQLLEINGFKHQAQMLEIVDLQKNSDALGVAQMLQGMPVFQHREIDNAKQTLHDRLVAISAG